MMAKKTAVIIGAGPAGLTAAYELQQRTDIRPIVVEASDQVGGISATIDYKGNKIDLGGHRFFSKSDRVMDWWLDMLPLQGGLKPDEQIAYQNSTRQLKTAAGPDPETVDDVMLLRPRESRIYFAKQFFDYPLSLSWKTIRQLGLVRMLRIGVSYVRARLTPIRPEESLEDFFINRFGRELYKTFFQSYTEKVWGRKCNEMSAEWGAQRVKGLSVWAAVKDAALKMLPFRDKNTSKQGETSLIEQFLYPKFGPGQMWEVTAEQVVAQGGSVRFNTRAEEVVIQDGAAVAVHVRDSHTGEVDELQADYVFSTMPIPHLLEALSDEVPDMVQAVSRQLLFRDFAIVGLLLPDTAFTHADGTPLTDNWLYIQDPDVAVGRIQLFHNWSKWLVADPNTRWIGMEYFLSDSDPEAAWTNQQWIDRAAKELEQLGFAQASDVADATVIQVPRAYPVYADGYDNFSAVRDYVDRFENIFCIGRNGMHRYNNQDHSMLAAMTAVDQIVAGQIDKQAIWDVNTEQTYHEKQS